MNYLDDGIPDLLGALIVHLRASTSITALCSAEMITGERKNIPAKSWGIALDDAGGPDPDSYVPLAWVRIDMKFLAPNWLGAKQLYRRAYVYLNPPSRQGNGFTAAHCRVLDIRPSGGPIKLVDPDDDSRMVFSSWMGLINEVPVLA